MILFLINYFIIIYNKKMEEIKKLIEDPSNLKLIGSGAYGKVYKLEYQGKLYAIKKISKALIDYNKDDFLRGYLKIALKREIDILKKMSEFENSINFYGSSIEENDYALILEFCDSDLDKLLKQRGKFSSKEILDIMEGLNNPFKFMHNNGILHRDIKPENIMIKYIDSSKTKFIPKIADYGVSRELDDGKATTYLGTPGYMAPEIILSDSYSDKSDLFSVGVMMYELYFNSFPYPSPKNKSPNQILKIYSAKKAKDCEDKLLDDLINKLLVYDPKQRITWEEYFKHPFFTQNQIEDLTIKLDKTKIYDEKEHQIINVYDYTIDQMCSIIKPINLTPYEKVTADDCLKYKNTPFFILGILGKYLEQLGISVVVERGDVPDISEYNKNIIQFICNSYILKNKYLLDFDLGDYKIKLLVRNPILRSKFNENVRKAIMKIYNLKEEEIQISNHRRENNKFTVIIVIKSNFKINMTKDELIKVFSQDQELKTLDMVSKESLIPQVILSQSMLCPQEDNKNNLWSIGQKRGGEDYYPPIGWIKYGININHCFNDRSIEWMKPQTYDKRGEWCVAYSIITGLTKTMDQIYANDDDIRHPGRKVGVGVYCPSHPDLLEKFTETINVNGEYYKVGFQIRVRPDKIRASAKEPKMWVVNGNDNELRPYGILIKKV